MTFNLNLLSVLRSNQVLKSVWEISSWCWPGSVTEGGPSASRGCLRRFLLLKLVTVLLFPHSAGLPLLVGCMFSLRALLLLRSPHISTKPSTVLLGQLALTDGLVPIHLMLQLGVTRSRWMEEAGYDMNLGLLKEGDSVWWREGVRVLCQQLLDAHHMASLLLLGLLGLEATLVSRWPQQTRRLRTSHWAQISCSLIWILVLLEMFFSLHSKLFKDPRFYTDSSTIQNSQNISLVPTLPLPSFSYCLRRMLWLGNLRLHYTVMYIKPHKRKSCFH